MRVIDAQLEAEGNGRILYDARRVRNPAADLFSRDFWAARDALRAVSGGRGSVCFIRPGDRSAAAATDAWVLRHYRRGGLVAKLLDDRYLWTGEERTRCFSEWRLLAQLQARGLPVPAPVAARYVRSGISYRADLITGQLPASRTLAESIAAGPLSEQHWHAIGRTIAGFHAHGVQHADLNAHNVLLDAAGAVFILDFDRGRIRARGGWEQRVLQRLRRSLEKITRQRRVAGFGEQQWHWLLDGLNAASRSSPDSPP